MRELFEHTQRAVCGRLDTHVVVRAVAAQQLAAQGLDVFRGVVDRDDHRSGTRALIATQVGGCHGER
jgi:hypothetical protein